MQEIVGQNTRERPVFHDNKGLTEQPHRAEIGIPSKAARPASVGAISAWRNCMDLGCRALRGWGKGRQRRQRQSCEEDKMCSAEISELYPMENRASEGVYFPPQEILRKPWSIFRMSSIYSVFLIKVSPTKANTVFIFLRLGRNFLVSNSL